jgi:hypothetical protein
MDDLRAYIQTRDLSIAKQSSSYNVTLNLALEHQNLHAI